MMASAGFKCGQQHYRIYAENNYGRNGDPMDWENPFDPAHTNYEDFYDGWCWERDKAI